MGEVGFGRRLPLNTSGRVFICKAFDFNLRSRLLPSGFSLTVSDMDEAVDDAIVLVTGASGFIASHVVQLLLSKGYRVRGTVRSLNNEKKLQPLKDLCPTAKHPLELVEAELNDPESWMSAVKDCTYVLHIASPFPAEAPKQEDELIRPAVDGTLAVLKACSRHKVKRVVLTSSVAAIFGDINDKCAKVCSEDDWANAETCKIAYVKSKTLAEMAAWKYMEQLKDDERFELAVINPAYVFGPIVGVGEGTSSLVIKKLMERDMPLVPRSHFDIADVRDVALAHLRAMNVVEAAGHRHIICNEERIWLQDVAMLLDKEFRPMGYNVPTGNCPDCFRWVSTQFALPLYSTEQSLDSTRMKSTLGITAIDVKKSIIDMAYDMIEKGFIKKTSNHHKN